MSSKRKVYLFYKITLDEYGTNPATPELYGFTENKELASLFLATRGRNSIIMRTKSIDEILLPLYETKSKDKMIFMNVLTDGKHSFDFPTTYAEDSALTYECECIHERYNRLNDAVLIIPFKSNVETSVDIVKDSIHDSLVNDRQYGSFNTFEIFTRLFKDTLV